ncbi:hypothetical protein [Actinokineospora globicatena]|uniref:hypothetical protein n=1 Tax=Actinokineospora globicatena TaxID=103729 RepID=UPI0020A33242|nr:hypothetical protein [Actinokineospora globicatena]MCP2304065.1 hypothetical protein [Actinokineospora globicatena]GLW78584.1 hypothetical protein Aglo01_30660 [Actinokineospora globicatena]GLW84749.1 hypothetical protein Aglo02_23890 [Actinokineospora globicatena]
MNDNTTPTSGPGRRLRLYEYQPRCPDCDVPVGREHDYDEDDGGCDKATCLVTGLQRLMREREDHGDCGLDKWTGWSAGYLDCLQLGWMLGPELPDVYRLLTEAVWDPTRRAWVDPSVSPVPSASPPLARPDAGGPPAWYTAGDRHARRAHADFYLGTGPQARWLGSLAESGHPSVLTTVSGTPEILRATTSDAYEAAVETLLADQIATPSEFAVQAGRDESASWPWLATDSSGWWAYTLVDGQVLACLRDGPWFRPDPHQPDGGAVTATGPDADLPTPGERAPGRVTFSWRPGFRGTPTPITETLTPVTADYLTRRGEVALTVQIVLDEVCDQQRPLPDMASHAIREILHSLLEPGPTANLRQLPDGVSPAYEEVVTALRFLLDADRYAESDNPSRAAELLDTAAASAVRALIDHHSTP